MWARRGRGSPQQIETQRRAEGDKRQLEPPRQRPDRREQRGVDRRAKEIEEKIFLLLVQRFVLGLSRP